MMKREGKARGRALVRCLRLHQRLQANHRCPPLKDLAREHGVCERTIRRDLAALEEAYYQVPALTHVARRHDPL